MKKRIFKLVQQGDHGSRYNRIFDYFIQLLIFLSILSIILESVASIQQQFHRELFLFDIFSVGVFSIEYLLRLYVSDLSHPSNSRIKSGLKFMFSVSGLIDLLAILPFYIPSLIQVDLRFLRIIRMVRIARLFKMNRYNSSLRIVSLVFKNKKYELGVTAMFAIMLIVISAFIMYHIEGDVQPEAFPNILASMWWAVATLTTVGYGDIYPITAMGKFLSGVMAFLGIGLIALPTGIISSGLLEMLNKKNHEQLDTCPHCGKKLCEEN